MADDAPTNATDQEAPTAVESPPATEGSAAVEAPPAETKTEAKTEAATDDAGKEAPAVPAPEEQPEPEPVPDPDSCKAIAIGLTAFWAGVFSGEWDDSDFEYYLEPAGVLSGPLVCTYAPEKEPEAAGLLMTRAAWKTKQLFLDDGVNPETYELSFPKEFGYVKPLAHYKPETRESAKYPWSKKY